MARLGIVERLYCEMHITVEPSVMSTQEFRELNADDTWRFSSFDEDDVDGIEGKWFLTARANTQSEAMTELLTKVDELRDAGHTVSRAKIEDTVFDTKHGDKL
jgi:hypothetical protein